MSRCRRWTASRRPGGSQEKATSPAGRHPHHLRARRLHLRALHAGASGFLLKNAPPEELVHAVRVVAAGDALLAPSVTRRIIEQCPRTRTWRRHDPALGRLTEREVEVLRSLATGRSNAELAAELYVGEGTIKTHVSSDLAKLGLLDRVQAVVYAYEAGLVQPGRLP